VVNPFLTSGEMANILGVHPRTLYGWLSLGLPRYQAMSKGHYRFNPTEIASWLTMQGKQVSRKVQKINQIRSIYHA